MVCHWSRLELGAGCGAHPGPAAGPAAAGGPGVRGGPFGPEYPDRGRNIPVSGIIDSGTMPRALVVLGAGGTVGTGLVEAALDSGHAVVAVGMDAAARHALLAGRPHAWLTAIEGAIGSDADAAVLALRLRALHVRIDGVIASLAGVHPCGRLMDEPADVLQRTLDQDLLPHLFAARHL